MHPLFSTVMSSPGVLLAHASAYAELASVELGETLSWHQRRLVVSALMWLLMCLAFALLSVSFMFHVALGDTLPPNRAPWLWLPPVLSVAAALASTPGMSQLMDLIKAVWANSPLRLPAQVARTQWRGMLAPWSAPPWASVAVAGFAITRHRHALMGLAAGTLWPKLSPSARAMVQTLLGVATSAMVDQWLQSPEQTSTDPGPEPTPNIAHKAHHHA